MVLVCFVVAPAATFVISSSQAKQYSATASVLFTNSQVAQQASGIAASGQSDPLGTRNTDLALVQLSAVTAQRTAQTVGHGLTAASVQQAVTASLQNQSNVVSIAATWTSPKLAAAIANAYANSFIAAQQASDVDAIQRAVALVTQQYDSLPRSQRSSLQAQSLQDRSESLKILKQLQQSVRLAEPATAPSSPSSPKVALDTALAAFVGLLLGVGAVFLIERLDRKLREPEELARAYGMPTLGLVPHGSTIGTTVADRGIALEPFRMLRAHLRYFNVDRELRVLLITSARPGEGKTTIAASLALASASMGVKTLLIEADLRKPTLEARLSLKPTGGLAGSLIGAGPVEDAVQLIENPSELGSLSPLSVLAAGSTPPNPADLLESHAMSHLLEWARENYELVIIDTAPVSVVADTIPLLEAVDGVIVVTRLGTSTRDSAKHLSERLRSLRTPVLGVVINDVQSRESSYYGYEYGSRYGQPTGEPAPASSNGAASATAGSKAASAEPEPAHKYSGAGGQAESDSATRRD